MYSWIAFICLQIRMDEVVVSTNIEKHNWLFLEKKETSTIVIVQSRYNFHQDNLQVCRDDCQPPTVVAQWLCSFTSLASWIIKGLNIVDPCLCLLQPFFNYYLFLSLYTVQVTLLSFVKVHLIYVHYKYQFTTFSYLSCATITSLKRFATLLS